MQEFTTGAEGVSYSDAAMEHPSESDLSAFLMPKDGYPHGDPAFLRQEEPAFHDKFASVRGAMRGGTSIADAPVPSAVPRPGARTPDASASITFSTRAKEAVITGFVDGSTGAPFSEQELNVVSVGVVRRAFESRFGELPTELEGYFADVSSVFHSEVPGIASQVAKYMQFGKKINLAYIIGNCNAIESGNFLVTFAGDRAARRGLQGMASSGGRDLNHTFSQPANRPWVDQVIKTSAAGFNRSLTLSAASTHLMFAYLPEMGLDEEITDQLSISGYDEGAFNELGDIHNAEGVSYIKTALALRQRNMPDFSKETLDARVQAFDDLIALELAGLAVSDLRDMGKLGRKWAQKATALYDEYEDVLFEQQGSADLLKEIAAYFSAEVEKLPRTHHRARKVLGAMSARSLGVVGHMVEFGKMLSSVYDQLGYEVHPALVSTTLLESGDEEPSAAEPAAEPWEEAAPGETAPAKAEHTEAEPEAPTEAEPAVETPLSIKAEPTEIAIAGIAAHAEQEQLRRAIFDQLDEIILPTEQNGVSAENFSERLRDIAETAARTTSGGSGDVMWERLNDLVTLSNEYGGTLYKSKRGSLGGPPYFVATFEHGGETIAIAETPIHGNATYVVIEGQAAGNWLEVLTLRRGDARDVGAFRIYHSSVAPHGERHLKKIRSLITEYTLNIQ